MPALQSSKTLCSQCPDLPSVGSQRGLETEPQRSVLPNLEIAGGRNRREGDQEADQVFNSPAAVESRVYELGPGIGFIQRQSGPSPSTQFTPQFNGYYPIATILLSSATGHSDHASC